MNYPVTVFDRPQWSLLPDPKGLRLYGNVDNKLEIARGRAVHYVALAVPTELFTLMAEVLKVPTTAAVSLSLDLQDQWFLFSLLAIGGEDTLHDLWAYPAKGLPGWMLDSAYIL